MRSAEEEPPPDTADQRLSLFEGEEEEGGVMGDVGGWLVVGSTFCAPGAPGEQGGGKLTSGTSLIGAGYAER